ncbi:MAG: diheme cytochrome c [Burkholderiales bacterium]|nr:diheme cytochrome c [Burkholderiales bacterium]
MRFTFQTISLALVSLASIMSSAHAAEHVYSANNVKWKTECSACHLAYPPQLLPAESWRVMMTQLDKHFGADASLDAKTAAEISAFLQANAERNNRATTGKPSLRITETRWFKKEHDEVPARVWSSAAVKQAGNCAACHTQAERGDFSERSLRVPR